MGMGIERSKALHNFTMPCGLRWGNQRLLRSMKVNSTAQIQQHRRTTTDTPDNDFLHQSPKVRPTPSHPRRRFSDDDGIAAIREKVMLDLQTAADKMRDAIFKDGLEEGEVSAPPPPPPATDAEAEPRCLWNLRTRRVGSRTAVSGYDADGGRVDAPGSSQMRTTAAASREKRERTKLLVALSKREIEEDFYSMVGHRPPRRPKKRPRTLQKQLDTLFPGLWLTEVTPDMYKVIEPTS